MTIDYEEKNLKSRNDTVDILKKIAAVLVIGGAFDSIFFCEWVVFSTVTSSYWRF